jgi:hypothetical protein
MSRRWLLVPILLLAVFLRFWGIDFDSHHPDERTALANDRRGRPNELELREHAVRQLEEAIAAARTDPDCWRRRERLAIYVKGVVSDSNLNVSPAQRAKYRDEAAAHLELALQAREPTRDDRERLEKLRAEIKPR